MRIIYLLPFLFIVACKAIYPGEKRDLASSWSPLTLEPAVEPYELHIDLIRQQDQSNDGETITSSDRPYHPLAVRFGNGLILDRSMNLGLSILDLFDIQPGEDFEIRQESLRFPGTADRIFERSGDHFSTRKASILPDRREVIQQDSIITVSSFLSRQTIAVNDSIWVRKGFLSQDKMTIHPDTICLRPFWNQCLVMRPGNVTMKRNFALVAQARSWNLDCFNGHWKLYPVGSSIYFVNRQHRGYCITRESQIIRVEKNGHPQWKYTLINHSAKSQI